MTTRPTVCVDVGSGWTKALGVGPDGDPTGCAQHPTTPHDLLEGVHAAASAVGLDGPLRSRRSASDTELLACSSAGGGLRLAVVGQDRLASTEAGHRAACSAGARVVNVQAGLLEPAGVRALRSARPDVVLLLDAAGDGGRSDAEQTLLRNAARLARARVRAPIVLAVRAGVRSDALAVLRATGRTVVATDAVFPAAGEIVPEPAREAMSELLAGHLVGGRGTTTTARFRRLARQTTPAAVRRGLVELVRARGAGGSAGSGGAVLVIDVGSSTTDVYSALAAADVPGGVRVWTTAEADLGMRPTAMGILTEGQAEGVVDPVEADLLGPAVLRLADEPAFLPTDAGARAEDRRLAALASVLAVRRHLRVAGRQLVEAGIGLVVLTGGVFRQPEPSGLAAVRLTLGGDAGLRGVLADTPVAVDDGFALAPAGLLAERGRAGAALAVLDAAIAPDKP
jgi:ADP-dependent NAD(P)H-hydrate dehydratase / NAD(P)H-hydrate epimerase